MNHICHIEIPVTDLEQAKRFYQQLFGWQIDILPDNHYALFPGGGFRRVNKVERGGITPYFQVEKLKQYIDKVALIGGRILVKNETAGNRGRCAFIQDPDGNVIGLYEENKSK